VSIDKQTSNLGLTLMLLCVKARVWDATEPALIVHRTFLRTVVCFCRVKFQENLVCSGGHYNTPSPLPPQLRIKAPLSHRMSPTIHLHAVTAVVATRENPTTTQRIRAGKIGAQLQAT